MNEESMDNNKPLTPDTFINKNLPSIRKVFPSLIGEDGIIKEGGFVKPESIPGLIVSLEDQVWQALKNDPILQKLGREKYNALPEGRRLKLLEDMVMLLDVAQEAEEFLNKKGE